MDIKYMHTKNDHQSLPPWPEAFLSKTYQKDSTKQAELKLNLNQQHPRKFVSFLILKI